MRKSILISTLGMFSLALFCSAISFAENDETTFLITSDKPAKIFIDISEVGTIADNKPKVFIVSPGSHFVQAISLDEKWESAEGATYSVAKGYQEIVQLKLTLPRDKQVGLVGSFVDPRDNIRYKTVTINGQTWMAENLRYGSGASSGSISRYNENLSFCINDHDRNCLAYGRHYFIAVARRACPTGWRLPSRADWESLISFYPGSDTLHLLERGKSNFNALRSGYVSRTLPTNGEGSYHDYDGYIGELGRYWTDAPARRVGIEDHAYVLQVNNVGVSLQEVRSLRKGKNATNALGASVRCIKD